MNQRLKDGLGPFLGKPDVTLHPAYVIGVAHNIELESGVGIEEFGDLTYNLGRLGFDGGLASVEINTVNCGMPLSPYII